MTAHLHPAATLNAAPLAMLSSAWVEAMQLRFAQIEQHGHDAAADDARGTYQIMRAAITHAAGALDMLMGAPQILSAQQQAVLRRRIIKSIAMQFAAIDALDRALECRHD